MIRDREEGEDVITGLKQKTYFGKPQWDGIFNKIAESNPRWKFSLLPCGDVERLEWLILCICCFEQNHLCLSACLLFVCLFVFFCLSLVALSVLSVCLFVCLSVYLSTCLSVCLSACLSVCLPACLSVYLLVCLSVCLPACLSVYQLVCLSVCLSVCLPDCLSVYLLVCLSVCLSTCLSVCLSTCLSVCLFPHPYL